MSKENNRNNMSNKKELPFDEKNKIDFEVVTAKIKAALAEIETNPAVPASGAKLAELAGCGRKTLYNRKWPVKKLDEIRAARKTLKIAQSKKRGNYEDLEDVQSGEEKSLALIENLQKENGEFFDRIQGLEEKLRVALDASTYLEREVQTLKQANLDLNAQFGKPISKSNIININSREINKNKD